MEIFWNIFFWMSLVAVVGIIAWAITNVVNRNAQAREYIADANNGGNYKTLVDRSDATNAELLATLSTLDQRLTVIEKTLTDIP